MPLTIKTSLGRTIKVEDKPFAKGGEGEVHRIISPTNSRECVKIYFQKEKSQEKENKIAYMAKNPPPNLRSNNHIICWPTEVAYIGNNFVGFTMPLAFDDSIELYQLCTGKLKSNLPPKWRSKFDIHSNTGIKSRLKLCTNLSSAIHSVHLLNDYVLVDLKPRNVLVTTDGRISLIDCDSIQITRNGRRMFSAKVATPEYVPPEGNIINPSKNIVPQTWDRFSMAIMFYEVIFGIHPYTASFNGRFENSTTLDSNIKNGLFVHGNNKSYVSAMPPLHENYSIIPNSLKELFNRAFNRGHNRPNLRPTAEEWGITLFKELKNGKLKFKPKLKTNPKPVIAKPTLLKGINKAITQKKTKQPTVQRTNKPQVQTKTRQLPAKQEEGIGGWCLLYGFFPLIGVIMTIVYYSQGKNRKGGQSLVSWIIGSVLSIFLF